MVPLVFACLMVGWDSWNCDGYQAATPKYDYSCAHANILAHTHSVFLDDLKDCDDLSQTSVGDGLHCGFDGCFYFYSTEQIKPEHIVGEDSLDNDEDSNKGEILDHVHYTVSILVRISV